MNKRAIEVREVRVFIGHGGHEYQTMEEAELSFALEDLRELLQPCTIYGNTSIDGVLDVFLSKTAEVKAVVETIEKSVNR